MGPEYHKIQTVFLRDPETDFKTLLHGRWSKPEFAYLANLPWTLTEKVDGTNVRIGLRTQSNGGSKVGGKTDNATLHPDLLERCYEIASRADESLAGLTLYGEGYGAGIQKGGGLYRQTKDFVLFDVWSAAGEMWLERTNVEDIAIKLGLDIVPVVGTTSLAGAISLVQSGGFASAWPGVSPEGLVMRPTIELRNRRGERVITKLKTRDFATAVTAIETTA